jgi:hypothetical protein
MPSGLPVIKQQPPEQRRPAQGGCTGKQGEQPGQAVNDRQQVEPMLARLQSLPEGLNQPEQVLADTGYLRSN